MGTFPKTSLATLRARRAALAAAHPPPALVLAGSAPPRNYPANTYPFRAASHFLYLIGQGIEGAALRLAEGRVTLFAHEPDDDDALWHGPRPTLAALARELGADDARPVPELEAAVRDHDPAILWPQDARSRAALLAMRPRGEHADRDAELAEAMIGLRLVDDPDAVLQLAASAERSAEAHRLGMAATAAGLRESAVASAMTAHFFAAGMGLAYGPIVTVHGEVLHSDRHDGLLEPGDLLLCDVGGETPEGWASDITRTWPVSGRFSRTQREIYDVVLASQLAAIDRVRPGTSYREVHETAKRELVRGLVRLGILQGDLDGLLERGAAALFFPHGVGHLLGLDVHDMEDLGDRAGYAPGRSRSARFGDRYLRLDRDLAPGMAVTIEPGFYQVPGILADARLTDPLAGDLRRDVLARYADVRGIRIEDDVLCTDGAPRVLSSGCPKEASEIEALVGSAAR